MRNALLCAVLGTVGLAAAGSQAAIIDDLNTSAGHFGYAPGFSGTTVGEDGVNSTTTWITTDSVDVGATTSGSDQIVLTHDTTTTNWRVRFVSGGPAYNSANAGAPASNTAFTTTSGTDGYIGYYLKTTTSGWKTSINLDGSGGTAAEMDGSVAKDVIADGEWHLYEWSLDTPGDWGVVSGIGGGHGAAGLTNGSHTIDSIYFTDGTTASSTIFFDFVAINPNGSVGNLVPEPASLSLLGLGGLAALRRRRA